MSIDPVQSSSPNKAAIAAGVVGAAALVGSAIYAAKTGKVADTFEGGTVKKTVATVSDGYKALGKKIANKATKAWTTVKSALASKKDKAADVAEEGKKAAEATVDAAEDVAVKALDAAK